jgi:hypothetical protein
MMSRADLMRLPNCCAVVLGYSAFLALLLAISVYRSLDQGVGVGGSLVPESSTVVNPANPKTTTPTISRLIAHAHRLVVGISDDSDFSESAANSPKARFSKMANSGSHIIQNVCTLRTESRLPTLRVQQNLG